MGKQQPPQNYREKVDTGASNKIIATKKEMGKRRFTLKKPVRQMNKVRGAAESKRSSGNMSKRTDLVGKRITTVK